MNSGTNRIETLQTALARTGSAAGFHELAALKLAASDVVGAIAAYAECLTFEPHNAALHNNYGAALIRAGRESSHGKRRSRPARRSGSR
jgi:Flp pilus assembly protein TadD